MGTIIKQDFGELSSNNANIEVLKCKFYHVNQYSYIDYDGTRYTVSGSPFTIIIPNVINCVYNGNDYWYFTNLTQYRLIGFFPSSGIQEITTNSYIMTPSSSEYEEFDMWIVDFNED